MSGRDSLLTTDALGASLPVAVQAVHSTANRISARNDAVATEEPLEIRLRYGPASARQELSLAITMRTPGADAELAVGFLYSEGIVSVATDVLRVEHCGPPSTDKGLHNVIKVALAPDVSFDLKALERHFYTSSSCGVCGKTSIEAVRTKVPDTPPGNFRLTNAQITALPAALRAAQPEFARTGGLHAAGLVDAAGRISAVREDVGRHNALDKLVGAALLAGELPLTDNALILSGRASFELVQKAAMAGCPLIAAIGPPSSLAVEFAIAQRMTLLGFVKADGFNIYVGPERLTAAAPTGWPP